MSDKMEMYEGFAGIYDEAMDNIPYQEWCTELCDYLRGHGLTECDICETGCGTGVMTELLAKEGYQTIGADFSESMLQIAVEKRAESGLDILYIEQDMRELELHKKMSAIISLCDSMNYMLSEEDLLKTFQSAKNNLSPGGLFIFDLKTVYCFQYIMGNEMWVEHTEDASYIWENYFHEENNTNEYMLTIFRQDPESGLYRRMEESHYQRAYELEDIKRLLEKAGFEQIDTFGSRIGKKVEDDSERVYIVAKSI